MERGILNYADEQRMAEIQWQIQMMDMISPLLVGTGLWLLLGVWVAFLIRKYQEKAWLVFVLAFSWGIGAQWFVRANLNYRWVDEPELYVLHEFLFKAIEEGESEILLTNIWDKRWRYVCLSDEYNNTYWHEGGDITVQDALGVQNEKGLTGYETEEIFVGDGKKFFVIESHFYRFLEKVFKKHQFREYKTRLESQGYRLLFKHAQRDDEELYKGCYKIENLYIKFIKK
jgi:hypothetical protein